MLGYSKDKTVRLFKDLDVSNREERVYKMGEVQINRSSPNCLSLSRCMRLT